MNGVQTLSNRSAERLRKVDWHVGYVEVRLHNHLTRDLFGCFDLLCVREPQTLAIQVTSIDNVAARVKKLEGQRALMETLLACGWVLEIHGWKAPNIMKGERLWKCRVMVCRKVRNVPRFKFDRWL